MILIAGQIESLATRKDKTIRLTIGTQELSPAEAAEVFQLNQQFCYIGLKPERFTSNETDTIESFQTNYDSIKSPSQRLRAILYRNFENNDEGYKDFNLYYIAKIDKICEHYKSKL
jgi:hypothetical protein